MTDRLEKQNPTSPGGVEVLFQGDFRQVKREVDQKLWPDWIREGGSAPEGAEQTPPGYVMTTSAPDWVTVEIEGGHLRVDRSRFNPVQEAYYRASQYESLEDWPNAAEAFIHVLSLNPDPVLRQGVTIMAGISYFHMGDLDRAARIFEDSIRLNEHNDFAHLFLGTARMLAGRLEEAVAPLRRSLELNPGNPHARFYLGYVYEGLGRWEEAIASYSSQIEIHKEATEAYEHLTKLYRRLGDDDPAERTRYYLKAIETYKAWSKVDPSNSAVRNVVGYLYTQIGNFPGALEAFAGAVEAMTDDAIALSHLGVTLLNTGRPGEAKKIFERLASAGEGVVREQLSKTSPDDLEEAVRLAMGETYQLLGAATLELHQSLVRAKGAAEDPRPLLFEAEAAFKTALEYEPADVHSLFNLGQVYYLLNRRVAATRLFSRVLELAPENEEAAKILRVVQDELEKRRRWLGDTVGRLAAASSPENPVHTEDLVEKIAEGRAKLYEGVDQAREDDAFSPEDLLHAMLPVAEWLTKNGAGEVRFELAARIFGRGWLSSGMAARLAGIDRVSFLTNLHRVGIAALDLDEEEMENQSRYVNVE